MVFGCLREYDSCWVITCPGMAVINTTATPFFDLDSGMIRAASEKMVRQFLQRDEDKPAGERSALMYIAMQRSFEKESYYFPAEVLLFFGQSSRTHSA
jgi:hypothetical protein